MAETLTVSRSLSYTGNVVNTEDHGSVTKVIEVPKTQTYGHGSAANQANKYKDDRRTVSAAPETIDLRSDLTDAFGNTIAFSLIKEITVRNLSTTSGEDLTISGNFMGSVLGATSHTTKAKAGGEWHQADPIVGFTVDSTNYNLTIDPGSDSIQYDLIIVGVE